jgi:HEAT repeat protein
MLMSVLLVVTALAPSTAVQSPGTRQVPVESLVYDLKNPDPVRRRDAAVAIGNNKVKSATPELVAAAGDSDASVRRAVVTALQQVEDVRALDGFVVLSNDSEADIRDQAIQGLTRLYLPRESGLVVTMNRIGTFFNPWSDEWANVVVEPDLPVDPRALAALEGRLQDPEESLRVKAARSLGILKGRSAIPSLVRTLKEDRSNAVRFEAARALRKIGDPAVGADLMSMANYGDPKVRNEAIYSVGRLRYAVAVPEITRLYEAEKALPSKNADKVYQERLLGALAFIGDPQSKDLFLKEKSNPDTLLSLHAYEGLARIADDSVETEVSADRLRERDARVKTAQAYCLYRLGRKEYLDEVVRALGSRRTNTEAREYLLELRKDELPDLYAQVSRNSDVNIREALAEIIGLVGDQGALPVLRDLQQDTKGQVSALATQALRRVQART